jgi:hypothetical protein
MGALIPNIAKGRVAELGALAAANDAFIWALFKSSGLEADSVLKDKVSLADLVSGATDEADFAGYARQTASGVAVTVDQANDWVLIDANDPSFSPTAAQALGKIGLFYDYDTTSGTDSTVIPVFLDDYVLTAPTSGTIVYTVATGGFAKDS